MFTTVIGNYPKIPNLPRPAVLRNALHDFDAKKLTLAQLKEVQNKVTLEAISEQEKAGVDIITDGQIRWMDELTYLARGMDGFEISGLIRFFDSNTYYRMPIAKKAINYRGPITVADFKFAKKHAKADIKPVITGPYTMAKLSRDEHYHNTEKFVCAIARALRSEIEALDLAGATMIHINEPAIVANKKDFKAFAAGINELAEHKRIKFALYTYFGDVSGIGSKMLDLPIDLLGLDFVRGPDNWEFIKEIDFTKELGLGIVDARNTKLEDAAYFRKNIDRALDYVKSDKLYVGPTCGLEFLPRERAAEKLANMVKFSKMAISG